jgi:hypothetical protein
MTVRREERAQGDGYGCALVPGLRASADAARLAAEIAFSSARVLALAADPPGLYAEIRGLAAGEVERATWAGFLTAYLCPLQDGDPFADIRAALAQAPMPSAVRSADAAGPDVPDLGSARVGPRGSHDPTRGNGTLLAYAHWASGGQAPAFLGDPGWTPQRRFARVFERLALPGLSRAGRYDLLVTLGRLGVYDVRPDSLALAVAGPAGGEDATLAGAKRVFAIADPMLLERRAAALAEAAEVPVEVLDLALANWSGGERATLGMAPDSTDVGALERASAALGA